MSVVDGIRKLIDMGMSMEQALVAAEAFEEAKKDVRSERNRRYYEAHKASEKRLKASESKSEPERLKASEKRLNSDAPRATLSSLTSIKDSDLFGKSTEVETDSTTSKATVYSPRAKAGFDEFWSLYPNKVGKPDAIKAFGRAIQRVELPVMIEGLRAYSAKTDDRPWCNPSTWLNQDRWNDRPVARAGPQRPLRGAALLAEKLRQEIENEGYLDAEGADPQACERLAIGGPGVRR